MAPEAPAGPEIFPAAAQGAAEFVGREWLLGEIEDWMERGTERVFLLIGEPGWGKSSLSAWLLGPARDPADAEARERLARVRGAWSAAHLCSAVSPSTVNPKTFCRSIARQLAARFDDFAQAFLDRAAPGQVNVTINARDVIGRAVGIQTERIVVETPDPRDAWEQSVRLPLVDVVAKAPAGEKIFLLIDGLDDALTFAPPNIVHLVAGWSEFPDRVRFLLTSRREPRILEAFPSGPGVRIVTVSDPGRQASNDEDVRAYVNARLGESNVATWAQRAGLAPEAFVDELVRHAEGNFLFIRFMLDTPPPSDGDRAPVPPSLQSAYAEFLRRVVPGVMEFGDDPVWSGSVKPVLGVLTVAAPAAPADALPRWVGGQEPVQTALGAVGQMTEWVDVDGGARRLYHRSLGDFLSTATLPPVAGEPEPNRFFIDPRLHHAAIVRSYTTAIEHDWQGDWSRCDAYGLRRLVPHLHALFGLTEGAERGPIAERLCAIALDERFQQAQRTKLGGAEATVEAVRLALDVCAATGDPEAIRTRAHRVATSWEPEARASAARAIAALAQTNPKAALDELKALVG